MDFAFGPKVLELQQNLIGFMEAHLLPGESVYRKQVMESGDPYYHPPVMEELKREARARGLWNLFLPDPRWGPGLSTLEYAPLAEITGRSLIAPEALNCSAPDTGNMEILAEFGTPGQQDRWLKPLLDGEIRSCFAMTEPAVASSDATNIQTSVERTGDRYCINGRKWWISGAASKRCNVAVVMGVTNPDADRHHRHSLVLVPMDSPGLTVVRPLPVFGYEQSGGHCELAFEDVRVPRANLLGAEGEGFKVAQVRLGPARIHHCMRSIGLCELLIELMMVRSSERSAFGRTVIQYDTVQRWIAESRAGPCSSSSPQRPR